jgi:hypothetical protein
MHSSDLTRRMSHPTLLVLTVLSSAVLAHSATCLTINPRADFVANFNKPCYALPLTSGNGLNLSGDANATYDELFYTVTPGYELVILGTFPNGRFMSATVYDEHIAITSSMLDQKILPLNSTMINPFAIGAVYHPNQQFGLTVGFGGTVTATPSPGCNASDTTIDQNFLDASQIHSGLTWTGYPNLPPNFPAHQTGPNSAGIFLIRKYLDIANTPPEVVIVRSTVTGCAISAQQAVQMNIVKFNQTLSSTMLNQQQIAAHQEFSNQIEPLLCYQPDPNNGKQWFRSVDYIPLANMGASLDINLTAANLQPLLGGQNFIRMRFPAPTTPNTPCAAGGCSLTGNEDLRYYSVSFLGPSTPFGKPTLTSLNGSAFVQDPDGNVTLVVGLGAVPPSTVTAANYYNYFDFTTVTNYASVSRIEIRHLLPNVMFSCSNANVPHFTMEYNPMGGFMGPFVATVDFPTGSSLTVPPPPPATRPNSCLLTPPPPQACGHSK